jgi:hypothetical protein
MEQWEKNYYISAIAGANNGSSLVVMSKGQNRLYLLIVQCFGYILFGMSLICESLMKV